MAALETIDYQNIKGSNTSTSTILGADFVPGPYGAILRQVTCFDNVYAITRLGTGDGLNWMNEEGDATGQAQRYGNTLTIPISRSIISTFGIGAAATSPANTPYCSFQYQLLPRTWSKVADPVKALFSDYIFYDDFLAGLDTTTNWNTPTVSTAGNIAAVSAFGCLRLRGDGSNWTTNGIYSKISAARASQTTLVLDVMLSPNDSAPMSLWGGWTAPASITQNSRMACCSPR